jgi:hypothetical protein
MNGHTLRSTAGLAGTFAAAAAGALTVGLISGVVHTAQAQSATTATSTAGTATGGSARAGVKHHTKSTGGLSPVAQHVAPAAGSNGS